MLTTPWHKLTYKPATGVGSVSLRFPRLALGASILHSAARTAKSLCSEAGRSRPPGRRLPQRQARGGRHKLSPTRHISGDANRRSPSAGHVSRCRCRCCRLPRLFAPAGPPGTAAPARRNFFSLRTRCFVCRRHEGVHTWYSSLPGCSRHLDTMACGRAAFGRAERSPAVARARGSAKL